MASVKRKQSPQSLLSSDKKLRADSHVPETFNALITDDATHNLEAEELAELSTGFHGIPGISDTDLQYENLKDVPRSISEKVQHADEEHERNNITGTQPESFGIAVLPEL